MPNWSTDTLEEQLAGNPKLLAEIDLALVYGGKSVAAVRQQYGYPEVGDGSITWEGDDDQGVRWDKVFDRHAAKVRQRHREQREKIIAEYERARLLTESLPGKGWTSDLVSGVSQVVLGRVLSGEMDLDEFRKITLSMASASRAIRHLEENDRRKEEHAEKIAQAKRLVEQAANQGGRLTDEILKEIESKVLGV